MRRQNITCWPALRLTWAAVLISAATRVPSHVRRGRKPLGHLSMMLCFAVGALHIGAALSPASAQIMLYENMLPDGYAFVRFVNATAHPLSLTPVDFASPISLGAVGADRVSPYFVVEKVAKRDLEVRVDRAGHFEFELKPSAFHTVVIDGPDDAIKAGIVLDRLETSQTKAQISFYNAVPSCTGATLYLEPGGQAVFKDVASNSMKSRAVNPLPGTRVRASCGEKTSPIVDLGNLDAGGQYGVWFIAPAGTPLAFVASTKFAPYQH